MLRDGRARIANEAILLRGGAAHELHVAIREGNSPRDKRMRRLFGISLPLLAHLRGRVLQHSIDSDA
jgi:hypothetical protein